MTTPRHAGRWGEARNKLNTLIIAHRAVARHNDIAIPTTCRTFAQALTDIRHCYRYRISLLVAGAMDDAMLARLCVAEVQDE